MIEIKHRVNNVVLLTIDAHTLANANLARADLAGADLADANLANANLGGADDAAQLGYPNSWPAFCWHRGAEIMVQVGCRSFTIAQGREYWAGKPSRCEVMAAIDYAEKIAQIRGWGK
jgi:hypothetical protein